MHPMAINATARSQKQAWSIFGLCFSYVIIRQVVLGPISPAQIPLYLANKAIAFTALVFLVQSACLLASSDPLASAIWGRRALHLSALHVTISLILQGQIFYPQFYDMQGILNVRGSLMLLFGALTAYAFWRLSHFQKGPRLRLIISLAGSATVVGHLIPQGIPDSFQPDLWSGHLPDVSLLSLAAIAAAIYDYWMQWRRQ